MSPSICFLTLVSIRLRIEPDPWISPQKILWHSGPAWTTTDPPQTSQNNFFRQNTHARTKTSETLFQRHIQMSINAWGHDHPWPQTHWLTPTDSLNDNYLGYFFTDAIPKQPAEDVLYRTGKQGNMANVRSRMWEGRWDKNKGAGEIEKCEWMQWWPSASLHM